MNTPSTNDPSYAASAVANIQTAPAIDLASERANTATHALGFTLSVLGTVYLAPQLRDVDQGTAIACAVYLISLLGVYGVSTLSHAIHQRKWRHRMRIWDQGSIYGLIAGTYTPFIWAFTPTPTREMLLSALWFAAILGFVSKVIVQIRVNSTTTYSYILLGWLPAMPLLRHVSGSCLLWMAAGGLTYSLGTLFLRLDDRHTYFHAVWHLLVILASAVHFGAIFLFVIQPAMR